VESGKSCRNQEPGKFMRDRAAILPVGLGLAIQSLVLASALLRGPRSFELCG